MEEDWKRIRNWINHFGIELNKTHVSGHASASQLKQFVEKVDSKKIIPVHTEKAEIYNKWSNNALLLKEIGEIITI
jgi:mRNA degradation ribonuclease J1/J2